MKGATKFPTVAKCHHGGLPPSKCDDLISIWRGGVRTVSMHSVLLDIGWCLAAIAVMGAGYTILAAVLAGRFMRNAGDVDGHSPAVTILTRLPGAERER